MSSPSLAHPLARASAFPGAPSPPPHHLAGATPRSSLSVRRRSRRSQAARLGRDSSRVRSLGSTKESEGEATSKEVVVSRGFLDLRPWDVPWDWEVTALVMMPYLMSIFLTGVAKSSGVEYTLPQLEGNEDVAVQFFANQFLKTMAKLSILYMFVSRHQPFPDDVFSFSWNQPFNLQRGWILWTGGGLFVASCATFLMKAVVSGSITSVTQNEGESLVQLLPLIGLSNISTFSLIGVLGILAPISEEILYRGFLMTSLTKWLPPHVSIIVSSAVFTLAHQSPGKSLEIFIFGISLLLTDYTFSTFSTRYLLSSIFFPLLLASMISCQRNTSLLSGFGFLVN